MNKFKSVLINLTLGLNIFLVFLSAFSNRIKLPSSLEYLGKFHPVVLHFPIVLVLLTCLVILLKNKIVIQDEKIIPGILLFTSVISAFTAIFGIFLSQQGGYENSTVTLHQWIGVGISITSYLVYLIYQRSGESKMLLFFVLIQIPLILIGSHEGGSLTHGENFLTYNSTSDKENTIEITDSSKIYAAFIEPIFSSKCYSCHNEKKAKGDLIMTNVSLLLKGGKNGKIWETGDPINSHIIQRASLSEDDRKHMPPKGKPQLTKEELDLLHAWIKIGAPIETRLGDYPATDSFRLLLNAFIPKEKNIIQEKFTVADPSIILQLQNAHRIIRQKSIGSNALEVRFSIREGFQTNLIAELKPISEQITDINCSNMPLTDSSILMFSMFPNLENLNINSTGIGNTGVQHLLKIKSLKKISLSNNPINGTSLKLLLQLPRLKNVFCWSTLADSSSIAALIKANPEIQWEKGYIPDTSEILQLTMPMLTDPELFVLDKKDAVKFKHPMPGISIKYTLDDSPLDSIHSLNYTGPIKIDHPTRIRSIAVKKGWLTSDTTNHMFFPKSDTPVFAKLISLPEEKYKAEGIKTLFNSKKGSLNSFSENWLGYKSYPLESIFMFDKNQSFHEIVISTLIKTGSYIMPPEKVELWAGNDSSSLRLIYTLVPKQPQKFEADQNEIYHLPVKDKSRFFKIKVYPISKLPKWHFGKGERGWTFVDEVFFY